MGILAVGLDPGRFEFFTTQQPGPAFSHVGTAGVASTQEQKVKFLHGLPRSQSITTANWTAGHCRKSLTIFLERRLSRSALGTGLNDLPDPRRQIWMNPIEDPLPLATRPHDSRLA